MFIFINMNDKYTYIGTCDRLRLNNPENELKWREMIKNKSELNVKDFKKDLDASQLLDDDETIDDFLNYLSSNDTIKFYKSKWGDKECKFIQTSGTNGFEYIFVNDNDMSKQLTKENIQPKRVSIVYLTGLRNNIKRKEYKTLEFIDSLIDKGKNNQDGKVELSVKQLNILELIKRDGKFDSKHFSNINENLDFSGFKMNKTLNNIIWDNNKLMKSNISDALLKIAKDYFISLKLSLPVKDITMTGSLANYNWSKYSDIDLHIVVDLNKYGEDKEFVKGLIDSKSREWNDKHDITIKGYEVEVYVQDVDEEHHSTGVYSILKDKWIIKPEIQDDYIDKKLVTKKYNRIVKTVNDIILKYDEHKNYNIVIDKIEKLKDKIKKMRQAGLESEGEYSTENIVFKLLRRNDIMKKINDLLIKSYDKSMTIDEELCETINEEEI